MPKSGHRAGDKISRRHTTIIDAAAPVFDTLHARSEVSKLSLGLITNIRNNAPLRIKFKVIPAGYQLDIRGGRACQVIYVYTSKQNEVYQIIFDKFAKDYEIAF